jgi:hypothetical protein
MVRGGSSIWSRTFRISGRTTPRQGEIVGLWRFWGRFRREALNMRLLIGDRIDPVNLSLTE